MSDCSLRVLGGPGTQEERGRPGRPVVGLAHGAGGGLDENFGALAGLLPERRLAGLDYPGSGARPAATEPLEVETLAEELVIALVEAGHARFPLVGMSLGSAVAVTAAARHPDRVTGLALVVGFAQADAQALAFADLYARLARAGRVEDLALLLTGAASSPATLETLDPDGLTIGVEALVEHHRDKAAGLAAHMDLIGRVDVRPELGALDVPTLVVVAGQDRIVLPATTRALAGAVPGAERAELPDAGHVFTPAEDADLARLLTDFWGRHAL